MSGEVLVLQHVPWEGPGRIRDFAQAAGLAATTVVGTAGDALPDVADVGRLAGLVLLGGPMGALDDDAHPVLAHERDLVRAAAAADVPVLGVCLGHQLVATALGAELHPGVVAELGVSRVRTTVASPEFGAVGERPTVLQWHFDTVDAPAGARVLAATGPCPVQAFRVGSAIAMQFHVEVTPALMADWLAVPSVRDELDGHLEPQALLAAVRAADTAMAAVAERALAPFLASAVARG